MRTKKVLVRHPAGNKRAQNFRNAVRKAIKNCDDKLVISTLERMIEDSLKSTANIEHREHQE